MSDNNPAGSTTNPLQPENQDLYRRMVEDSRDGICITQNGMFKYVNKAFCDMLGYSAEELTTLTGPDLLAPWDKERVVAQHYRRMQGEHGKEVDNITMIRKNGSYIDIEMSANSIRYNNDFASFISARDITERKRMQEALEKSEQKYRMLIENAQDGIIITQDGKFKLVNKAFCDVVGYSEEELLDSDFLALVANEDKERLKQYHVLRMSGSKHHMIYEARAYSKSGKLIDFEINTTFVEFNDRPATFIILRDQTERRKLEEQLRNNENKYRRLFEAESDAIFLIDKESGNILDANPAASNIYGYSHEEFLKLRNLDMSAEPEKTKVATQHDSIYVPVRYHKKKDGTVFPVEITAGITELDNHKVHIITIRDISERLKIQEALAASEHKYRELTEMLPQAIYELDAEGKPTYMNKAGLAAFGIEKDAGDKKAFDFFVPEDMERMKNSLRLESLYVQTEDGISHPLPSEPMDFTALRSDGTTFPVLIYGTAIVENGKVVGSRGIIVDISERKAMEEALRRSEDRYRRVIQSLQEGLFVIQDEKFIFVNEAIVTILGYTVEEMMGESFYKVVPPDRVDQIRMMHQERKKGDKNSWSYEYTLLHKDGVTRIPVILSTNQTEFDGKMAVVGTAKDITDRIKAEEELKMAHRRLEEINHRLEETIEERTRELTEANTQLLKVQKENLQSQFDVLKQQVNPHFLFNSLNVLTSLIRLEPDLAEKFTEHLSKVYRYVLENKDNELVQLSTELDFLDAYLFLLNIRFMNKLQVNINISDRHKDGQVIPLAMQLLIENAIKHNAMSKKSPLVIDIFVDDQCYLNIINNLQAREAHMSSTGVGLQNIQNRYRLLNNTVPQFEKTETQFIARIPLICD
ncbi:MAG: PAS domain S-box protein [Bacteroidetes bacterium]|nr:PAS domain S-box protein [Bacteroidota bacterium]